MMKRHEVQVLRRAGVTQEQVAKLTGISVRSVRMIEAEEPVVAPDDAAEREKRGIGRPSKAEPFRGFVAKLLAEDPELLSLAAVTSGRIEAFLQAKTTELAPQTVNHLRSYLSRAFNAARRAGRWPGPNPAQDARKRKVPRRQPDYLRPHEVPLLLRALDPRWRPIFAAALYTGLRKGELLALRKTDVDLARQVLTVARSHERDTTKGGHADVIPIATELVPFLRVAIAVSPSELVFPKADGTRMRADVNLEWTLRRALGRAGVVEGYRHACRRQGCGHVEPAQDQAQRRCPKDGRKLWVKPVVRPIRFHDLRHDPARRIIPRRPPPSGVAWLGEHRTRDNGGYPARGISATRRPACS